MLQVTARLECTITQLYYTIITNAQLYTSIWYELFITFTVGSTLKQLSVTMEL